MISCASTVTTFPIGSSWQLAILHDTARPFSGVPEMDEALIANWNARVGADDSVYIVGDFSYNGGEAPTQYLARLNGHLHLIRGNHDTGLNHAERLLDYCDSVTDFLEIDDGGTHILLCHYPILHEKGGYMIHGHIHNQRNHAYEILKTLPRVLNAGLSQKAPCLWSSPSPLQT